MLTVVNYFFQWMNSMVLNLMPIINSWMVQVPMSAIYLFRLLYIFRRIVPDD